MTFKKFLCFALFTCFIVVENSGQTTSQNYSPYTYISSVEAETIEKYINGKAVLDLQSIPFNKIDSFPNDSLNKVPELANGHYLLKRVARNDIEIELVVINDLDIEYVQDLDKTALFVRRKNQNHSCDSLSLFINGNALKYNPNLSCYESEKKFEEGYLKIQDGEKTFIYAFQAIGRKPNFWKKLIYLPVIKHFHLVPRRLFGDLRYTRYHKRDNPSTKGYLVFNKPKFRTGDTLKIKSFLCNKNGRVLKKDMGIYLEMPRANKAIKIGEALNNGKGAYTFEYFLSDSLKLDKRYYINIRTKKGKELISRSFRLEDYVLKEANYSLELFGNEGRSFGPDNSIGLKLSAKDINELNLYDCRADLRLSLATLFDAEQDIFIPNLVWKKEIEIETIGETVYFIPDSVMPRVNAFFKLEVQFKNSQNEIQSLSKGFKYSIDKTILDLKIEQDSIKANCFINGIERKTAKLREIYEGKSMPPQVYIEERNRYLVKDPFFRSNYTLKNIELPYTAELKTHIKNYELICGAERKTISNKEPNAVEVSLTKHRDSTYLYINNPAQRILSYALFKNNQLIQEATIVHLDTVWESSYADNFEIVYFYLKDGEIIQDRSRAYTLKNELEINIDFPKEVRPGETLNAALEVKDYRGQSVQGVDLTAFAYNAKFEEDIEVNLPYLGKPIKKRKVKKKRLKTKSIKRKIFLKAQQLKKLGIDSLRNYQLRFPKDGFALFEDSISSNAYGEIVVHLFNKYGDQLEHSSIYANETIVYNPEFENRFPSIPLGQGSYDFKILRWNEDFVFKNVEIRKGIRTTLSLNVDAEQARFFRLKREQSHLLNKRESHEVFNSTMKIWDNQNSIAFIEQNGFVFLRPDWSYRSEIGPMRTGRVSIHYKDDRVEQLEYKPGYTYRIQEGYVELIKDRKRPEKHFMRMGSPFRLEGPDYFSEAKKAREKENQLNSFRKYLHQEIVKGTAKVQLYLDNISEPEVIRLVNLENPYCDYFDADISLIKDIKAGNYLLELLYSDTSIIRTDTLEIRAEGKNYFRLNASNTQVVDHLHPRIGENYLFKNWNMKLFQVQMDSLKLKNQGTGEVKGLVKSDLTNLPIEGARVYLLNDSLQLTGHRVETDSLGHYHIKGLPEGSYKLLIDFIGHETLIQSDVAIEDDCQFHYHPLLKFLKDELEKPAFFFSESDSIAFSADSIAYSVPLLQLNSVLYDIVIPGHSVELRTIPKRTSTSVASVSQSNNLFGIRRKKSVAGWAGSRKSRAFSPRFRAVSAPNFDADLEEAEIVYSYARLDDSFDLNKENRVIEASNQAKASDIANPLISYREEFRDYAFWEADLKSDFEGKAYFQTTFPGDITKWKTTVLGMSAKKLSGHISQDIRSYKNSFAQLSLPQFLIQGDQSAVIGKVSNYSDEDKSIRIRLERDGELIYQSDTLIDNSIITSMGFMADEKENIEFKYGFRANDNESDGERRDVPIFRKGMEIAIGEMGRIAPDSNLTISIPANAKEAELSFYTQPLDLLREDIVYLEKYKHSCNEQMASRLIALLMKKALIDSSSNSLDKKIRKQIKALCDNKIEYEGWSWWGKQAPATDWVTIHCYRALTMAKRHGFDLDSDLYGVEMYLSNNISAFSVAHGLECMLMMLENDYKLNYEYELERFQYRELSTYERLSLIRLYQLLGLDFDLQFVLDSKKETALGDWYWEDPKENNLSDYSSTLMAYAVLQDVDSLKSFSPRIENYIIQEKMSRPFLNTYTRARILQSLLANKSFNALNEKSTVRISGDYEKEIARFPSKIRLNDERKLNLNYKGNSDLIYSLHHKEWDERAPVKSDHFKIESYFEEQDKRTSELREGAYSKMRISVECMKTSKYVALEIPIPAGCFYADKNEEKNANEVHREYKKDRAIIYIENMKEGKHEYSIAFQNRFKGSYTLNPIKIELMYFPLVNGNNELKNVSLVE
ncbi:MAG: alpha-2-macroglobulin family protein [Bacteroidota bacterium]